MEEWNDERGELEDSEECWKDEEFRDVDRGEEEFRDEDRGEQEDCGVLGVVIMLLFASNFCKEFSSSGLEKDTASCRLSYALAVGVGGYVLAVGVRGYGLANSNGEL